MPPLSAGGACPVRPCSLQPCLEVLSADDLQAKLEHGARVGRKAEGSHLLCLLCCQIGLHGSEVLQHGHSTSELLVQLGQHILYEDQSPADLGSGRLKVTGEPGCPRSVRTTVTWKAAQEILLYCSPGLGKLVDCAWQGVCPRHVRIIRGPIGSDAQNTYDVDKGCHRRNAIL